ncbi:hypothetical protein [Kitasatospora sp. NPDC048407]|uniref:hypothetical protein n=1 Tax=Kitasatospora sp. NPDC048407 TaxID=3364051 RepID=UPI0037231A57
MRILRKAEPLPPAVEETTPYHLPDMARPTEAPASGTLAAIVDHLTELRVQAVAAALSVHSERSR